MKAKISGIVALLGAAVVAVYTLINLIDFFKVIQVVIQYGAIKTIIAMVVLVVACVLSISGGIKAFKKTVGSQIVRGVAAALLIVFGALGIFQPLMIVGLVAIVASIVLDYILK